MKQFYLSLFFIIFSLNILTAQWGSNHRTPNLFATDDYVLMYGNVMEGEVFINDTVSIGNSPYDEPFTWQFIAMLDTASHYIWHKKIGQYGNSYSLYGKMGFTIDNNNSIYVASSINVGNSYYAMVDSIQLDSGMYILKLDQQGNILNLIQPTQWLDARFHNITLTTDTQNNLYIAGNFGNNGSNNTATFSFGNLPLLSTNTYSQGFIAKLDQQGNPLWLDTLSSNIIISDIEFANNQLYLTSKPNPSLYSNQFIDKMDTDGNLIKSINVASNFPEDESFSEFELASDGYWISGSYKYADFGGIISARNETSLYLAKYDFNDSLIYLKLTPDTTTANPRVQSLSVNDNDEVFWQFAFPCDNNCTWIIDGQIAHAHSMMKLNSQGTVDCVTPMNRPEISANSTHYFSLSTYFSTLSAKFNLGKWNNNCYKEWENDYIWHIFLGSTKDIETNTFQVFPNPATNQLFLKTERTDIYELQYQILNISGQIVQNGIINPSENQGITLNDFAGGVYFLQLQSDEAMETLKFVKY